MSHQFVNATGHAQAADADYDSPLGYGVMIPVVYTDYSTDPASASATGWQAPQSAPRQWGEGMKSISICMSKLCWGSQRCACPHMKSYMKAHVPAHYAVARHRGRPLATHPMVATSYPAHCKSRMQAQPSQLLQAGVGAQAALHMQDPQGGGGIQQSYACLERCLTSMLKGML